jgi:hypothetical protein
MMLDLAPHHYGKFHKTRHDACEPAYTTAVHTSTFWLHSREVSTYRQFTVEVGNPHRRPRRALMLATAALDSPAALVDQRSICPYLRIADSRFQDQTSARSAFDHGHGKYVASGLEFRTMQGRKPNQQALASRSQMDFYFSAITFARSPLNESPCLAARNERYHAMGLGLQTLGKLADMRVVASGVPLDVQKQQILKRSYAVRSSGSLGKSLESPHLITKFGQLLEARLRHCCVARSSHRVPPWKIHFNIYHIMIY